MARRLQLVTVFVVIIIVATFKTGVFQAQATAGQIMKMVTSDGGSTFYVGRCFRMNIRVQTDNLNANSVDVIIPYNSTYVQPYADSSCTTAANPDSAVLTDSLFPSYPYNKIVDSKLKLTAYDQTNESPVNTGAAPADSLLAHVWWKVMSASGAFNLRFEFTPGSTTDTNMAQQNGDGSDVLDSVENLSLTLVEDTTKPTFSNLSPASGATGISVTTGVTYTFSDTGAGIDTSSLTNKLSGTSKSLSTSGCTTTNSNRTSGCNVTMSSVGTLSYYTWYVVAATGSDLASPTTHSASQAWWFRTEDDTDPPYLGSLSPASGATGVAVGSNIVFHVKDYKGQAGVTPGLGVDISTVQVTVTPAGGSPIVYNYSSPQFGYTGTSADYTVTINPTSDFSQNTVVTVAVEASDSHAPANAMSTYTYSFRTADSSAPTFSGFSPAQDATDVAPDSNVVFHILDTGTGVDLNNTTVTVAGTSYTKTGSPSFSYTGTAADYTITVNPSSNFTGGQVVTVSISTRDLDSNTATTSYSFTVRNTCTTCSVDTEDPARFTTSATLDATVSFHVKDTGSGIKESSIKATLTGTGSAFTTTPLVLTGASSLMDITGTSADYTVTITLPAAIQQNKTYSILIEATDADSVPMDDVAYSFANIVTTTTAVASSCATTTATTGTTHTGGGNRNVQDIIAGLESADLPVIVARRRLPGTQTIVTEELSPEVARKVDRCYVDEAEATHAAALAQKTKYRDVPAGIWYEDAVAAFLKRGILDTAKEYFRGGAPAARAEVAKVLSKINTSSLPPLPEISAFDDADRSEWYTPFVEFSAQNGWMRGYGDCAGTHPCFVRPGSTITRAEAVAMIVRFSDLQPLSLAPRFTDVPEDAWYVSVMQTAADRCIVQGDAASHRAHPAALLTRAELIVLLHRAEQQLRYGTDCSWGEEASPANIARPEVPESVPESSSSPAPASLPPPTVAPALPIEAQEPSFSAEALPARMSSSGWPAKASLLAPSASSSESSVLSSQAAVTSATSHSTSSGSSTPKNTGVVVLVLTIAGIVAAVVIGRMLL